VSRRVCLVTSGQPASNPRLVKEADALAEAGYRVRAIGAHWADWADAADVRLLAGRPWTCEIVDWRRESQPALFWWSRIRHRAARVAASPAAGRFALLAAAGRVTPELARRAARQMADLYIAHNLGALPAAARAARQTGARLGFDAEDFHSGQFPHGDRSAAQRVAARVERAFIPRCDQVTAASPGIGRAYAAMARRAPETILNVFPLSHRPPAFRTSTGAGPVRMYWFSQTIGPGRGLEDAVRLLGRFPRGAVELHLRGVWSPGYEEALRAAAREAGVDPANLAAYPPADPDEMARLASAFDIGLALETGETPNSDLLLSNKIFSYLLGGLAVLATRTQGQEPIARDLGTAAVTYRPGDVGEMAARVGPWIADRAALDRARRAAWDAGEARFNWDREKARFLALVDRTLARS
jgi:hypothetical protein